MGSILPPRACSVRSVVNLRSASCLPIAAGAMAPLASPGAAPPAAPLPSLAVWPSSTEPATICARLSASSSGLTFSNWREIANSALRRKLVLSMPSIT